MSRGADKPTVRVAPSDFVAAREVARGFSALVEELVSGERERVVVLHRNRPTVVMLAWDEYARLQALDGGAP